MLNEPKFKAGDCVKLKNSPCVLIVIERFSNPAYCEEEKILKWSYKLGLDEQKIVSFLHRLGNDDFWFLESELEEKKNKEIT